MRDTKHSIILAIITVLAVVVLAGSLTYAYFASNYSTGDEVDVKATTASRTKVEYNMGSSLELLSAEPGASEETISNIVLTASNATDDTFNYEINWIVTDNDFEYESEHPTDPQLTYSLYYSYDNTNWTLKTTGDCTNFSGSNTIATNEELTATKNTVNTIYWKLVVSYKSYDYNQATNMQKSLNGYLEFSEIQ